MGKNYQLLILGMVSFLLLYTISTLITSLGYHRLLQIYFQCISFVYKIAPFVILMLIDSQFRIYLRGKSYTKGYLKMGSILFHPLLLFHLHLHPLSIPSVLLLFLLRPCFGTKDLGILVPKFYIWP